MDRDTAQKGREVPDGEGPRRSGPDGAFGRRALVMGAAAGVGVAAGLVAASEPASATENTAVLAGETNTATSTTEVITTSGSGLLGVCDASSGLLSGFRGGTVGDSLDAYGVIGASGESTGVLGKSGSPSDLLEGIVAGVIGDSSTDYGVFGGSKDSDGVLGVSAGPSGLARPGGVVGDSSLND